MAKRTRKPKTLYVTRDGASDDVYIWLGKPALEEEACADCGGKRVTWNPTRGARALLEDVCDEGFRASGIIVPPNGIVKFKILAEET